jgi:cell division septation protein DedD
VAARESGVITMTPHFEAEDRSVVEFQLGNKQLLLLFVGLLVICAIFFFIGLRVGEDTARSKAAVVVSDQEGLDDETSEAEKAASPKRAVANRPLSSRKTDSQSAVNRNKAAESNKQAPVQKPKEKTENPGTTVHEPSAASTASAGVVTAPNPGWYVQVASLTKESGAHDKLKLLPSGYATAVHKVDINGRIYFRALVGPFPDKDKAQKVRSDLGKGFSDSILKHF